MAKKLSSLEVMEAFIARCKEINPLLNCVVDNRFEEALKEAKEVDNLIESGKYTVEELKEQKPFLGVPISTKDNISLILARKFVMEPLENCTELGSVSHITLSREPVYKH
uniref:Amidase domain-containing protein n=1 Tax=Megaselia scalaris TaxID=36166 RepID=T1GSI4_MEGSC